MAHCKLRMHTRGSQPSQFWSHLPDSSRFTSARSPFRKHKCAPVDDHRCWLAKLQSGLVLRGFEACILHYRRVSLNEPRTTCSVALRSRVFIRVTANRTVTGRAPISCPIYAVQLRSLVANDGQPFPLHARKLPSQSVPVLVPSWSCEFDSRHPLQCIAPNQVIFNLPKLFETQVTRITKLVICIS